MDDFIRIYPYPYGYLRVITRDSWASNATEFDGLHARAVQTPPRKWSTWDSTCSGRNRAHDVTDFWQGENNESKPLRRRDHRGVIIIFLFVSIQLLLD